MKNLLYYFRIALRNLRRGRIYSMINVGGLAVGMAATLLIVLWIQHEWSYNRFHEKKQYLYQILSDTESFGRIENTPQILGPTLLNELADITNMSRYRNTKELYTYEDQKLNINTAIADSVFLKMFSFPLLRGDINTALNSPESLILTEDAAKRLFGEEDPMGKNVLVHAEFPATVTGILADLPDNSSFRFEALLPFSFMKQTGSYSEHWGDYDIATYVESQADAADMNTAINAIFAKHVPNNKIVLHHISKWRLYSGTLENGVAAGGRIETLRLFASIALLILLIACINFMNLSTARSAKRAREVGIRKVVGTDRRSLVVMFLGESVLIATIAALLGLMIVQLMLPLFNNTIGQQIHIDYGSVWFWLAMLAFILFTGILAGSYPAFHLSSFRPLQVLKAVVSGGRGFVTPRKVLIVFQFVCAIVLIVSTAVVQRQVKYAQARNTGYNKDQLIWLDLSKKIESSQELIRHELLNSGAVVSVTRTLSPITDIYSSTSGAQWRGKEEGNHTTVDRYYVDADWVETIGAEIIQGRDIDMYTYATDSTAMLLNEAAVKLMGFNDPIGEIIRDRRTEWHVVGVVKDVILESPYDPVQPMMVGGPAGWFNVMHVRLNGANKMADNLALVEKVFKTYNPDYPFVFDFVDEVYARKFAEEQRMGTLSTWFATLAIFISCLGLFGLSAYMAENRRKEIGVRKVLGASITNITSLLSGEFLTLIMVALIIAYPIAWWVMRKWLGGYVYHTNIPWWLFLAVAALTFIIALFTVSFQAIRAATENPVKSIKTE